MSSIWSSTIGTHDKKGWLTINIGLGSKKIANIFDLANRLAKSCCRFNKTIITGNDCMNSLQLFRLRHEGKVAFLKREINCLQKLGTLSPCIQCKSTRNKLCPNKESFSKYGFPPVLGGKWRHSEHAPASNTGLSLFPPGFQTHFQAGVRGSPGTGLWISRHRP